MITKTLHALGSYYNDIELEFKEVDLIGADDIEMAVGKVTDNQVIVAKKTAVVQARPAVLGEMVETNPRCIVDQYVYSLSETTKEITQADIDNGCMVVTNPDGENYVVKGEKFEKTYKEVEGGYVSKDNQLKLFTTVTEDICFKAPWGEMMFAPKGSKLCIDGIDQRDIYSVTNSAFNATYKEKSFEEELAAAEEELDDNEDDHTIFD